MRCCVPFCKYTSENVFAETKGISFYAFPSEVCLRAAWLRALGKQNSHLPDSAVVCSQHFLNDDIYETESGFMQIRTGAIPSTVQVCMICLDTDSKLFLMSKYKLDEAYEQLTGHALCDQRNLKQTVCVQCAQRLINCSQFRDKCLRARALMMDLVEKHELITRQHVKMINRTTNKLSNNIVMITLGPDPCDLYVLEHTSEDKQTDSEATIHRDVVKKEENFDSIFIDENMEVANEDVNDADYIKDEFGADNEEYEYETQDPFKNESAPFQCTVCFGEFVYENSYMQHMIMHIQNGAGDGECAASQECEPHTAVSSDTSLLTESRWTSHKTRDDTPPALHSAQTAVAPSSKELATNNENKTRAEEADTVQRSAEVFKINNRSFDTSSRTNIDRWTNCVIKLYDVYKNPKKVVPVPDSPCHSLVKTKKAIISCDNQCHIDNEDIELVTDKLNANNLNVSRTLQSKTNCSNNDVDESCSFIENNLFICDVCKNMFERKRLLVKHIKTHTEVTPFTRKYNRDKLENKSDLTTHMRSHTGEKRYSCELCEYKSANKSNLAIHMRTHTGEKPFHCQLCKYKFGYKSSLVAHMRTHTGEKPYTCEVCNCKFAQKCNLVSHIKTHTGEKPFHCQLCEYESAHNSYLVIHMRTHTGENLFHCQLCKYKAARKSHLVRHMRTHTGEKPFHCQLCKYKCGHKSSLVIHMRKHTDEKPFYCQLCKFKCGDKSNLVIHMRTHTGEKPFHCQLCKYKCGRKSSLVAHMRTHTGEKPYTCKVCNCKFAQKCNLVSHIKTHTGEKPFHCQLCEYKSAHNRYLVSHMRTHTGEKLFHCQLCKYKAAHKSHLERHMRTHTGEKPFHCQLCKYKCRQKGDLVKHMRTHTGEKPFYCQLCEFKCGLKRSLVIHMRTHTGEKPFHCQLCKYKCARQSSLVVHVRTHTGEKPYTCEVCNCKFAQKCNLVSHIKTHTGEKPFHCQLCEYKSAHNGNLVSHMRTHTGEK